jgi:hypothetical protein
MLFKPSQRTRAILNRGAWIFLPLWIGSAVYFWLVAEGVISQRWDALYFPVAFIWLVIYIAHTLKAFASVTDDLKRSQHPDQDVADLIDGRIDIGEYRARKELGSMTKPLAAPAPRDSHPPSQ